MRRLLMSLILAASLAPALAGDAFADVRVGGGIHYLRTLGDIKDTPDFDENAIGFMAAFKYHATMLTLEGDLEFIPDYGGSGELLWEPQGYVLIGSFLYGGIGAGIGYLGDLGWQDPFFALRAGVDFMLGPVDLDVFASYRFQNGGDLGNATSDDLNSISFGALVFFSLGK